MVGELRHEVGDGGFGRRDCVVAISGVERSVFASIRPKNKQSITNIFERSTGERGLSDAENLHEAWQEEFEELGGVDIARVDV